MDHIITVHLKSYCAIDRVRTCTSGKKNDTSNSFKNITHCEDPL